MNTVQLKDAIVKAISDTVEYISKESYWDDLISFSLYSDEDYMSLALLFNTNAHYQDVKDDEYPLTYKFSPAEWFSETLYDDHFINNNEAFTSISEFLFKESSNCKDFSLYKSFIEESCKLAILYCIENNVFRKPENTIYLFMISDGYDEKEIIRINSRFNSECNNNLLAEWIGSEF